MNLRTRAGKQKAVLGIVAIAIVAFTFLVVLPRIADYRSVWAVVTTLDATWIAVLLGVTALNIVTYAPPWMVALPGFPFKQALPFTQASTAFTYVAPGGGVVGMAGSFGLLRLWGYPNDDVARAVTITGIWNQLSNLLLPVAAVFMLTAEEETDTALTTIALVGAAVFTVVVGLLVLVFWSESFATDLGNFVARTVNRVWARIGREPVAWGGATFASFRTQTVGLIRRRWWLLTLVALLGNLTVFLVLLCSLRAVGVTAGEVTWIQAFAAWSVARVIQLIPLTPGGLGVVEVGLTSVLVAFGGDNAEVVAATLVYRFLTIVPTLLLGLATIVVWRRLGPSRVSEGDTAGARNRPTE